MNDLFRTAAPSAPPPTAGERRHRLFFALRPDAAGAERISRLTAQLRGRHRIASPAIPRERQHISLNFVGSYPAPPARADVERVRSLADRVAMPPFVVTLNRVESWKGGAGGRPLVLLGDEGVIGVHLLHGAIHAALAEAGLRPAREPERCAHLTLLWGRHEVAEILAEPVTWTVREFLLLDSPFGEGRHELLGRWTLAG